MRDGLPFACRRKAIEILIKASPEPGCAGPDYSSQIDESFFIDLVVTQKSGIVTKILKKPFQLPQCPLAAVNAAGKGSMEVNSRFQDSEAHSQEGLFRMPAVGS